MTTIIYYFCKCWQRKGTLGIQKNFMDIKRVEELKNDEKNMY